MAKRYLRLGCKYIIPCREQIQGYTAASLQLLPTDLGSVLCNNTGQVYSSFQYKFYLYAYLLLSWVSLILVWFSYPVSVFILLEASGECPFSISCCVFQSYSSLEVPAQTSNKNSFTAESNFSLRPLSWSSTALYLSHSWRGDEDGLGL